jgi:para-aminobenzoate synthetase component 1
VGRDGRRTDVDWLAVLDDWCRIRPVFDRGPIQTGAIGYVAYEANPACEDRLGRPADVQLPEVRLVRYGGVLVLDHKTGRSVWAHEPDLEDEVRNLERRWYDWRESSRPSEPLAIYGDITPDFSREELLAKIRRTIAYIRSGDIFQANITGRFSERYQGDLFEAYAELRRVTPNPFFAYLDFITPVLSTSPERFFQVTGRRIHSRPIKGTARAVVDGADQHQRLLASVKDRAENTMIVDVVRNDLGRVCKRGSVRVDALCEAKRFNQLYHLESTVSGELALGTSVSKVLGASFPPASISGAPKLRAIEVIDEMEPGRRGPYCGAIGFFGSHGWIDTSVGIRVVYADGERVYVHAGGGIVADSDPNAECEELLLKVERVLHVLGPFNVLTPLRRAIDVIDDRLFDLLAERFAIIDEVAKLKRQYGIPSLQQSRVTSMIEARERALRETSLIPRGLVSEMYELLVRHAMKVEERERT